MTTHDTPEEIVGNCPECDAPIGDSVPGCVHWPTTHDTPEAALRWAVNRAEQRELEALAELDEAKAEVARLRASLTKITTTDRLSFAKNIARYALEGPTA
jgi:hypothetical protein